MSDVACAVEARRPWYRWQRFPLLPEWGYRPENRHNRADWWFHWLGLHCWTMMSPDLEVSVTLDDQSLSLRLFVPYLIIDFRVPLFPQSWHQKLWRTKKWEIQS